MSDEIRKAMVDLDRAMTELVQSRERLGRDIEHALNIAIENLGLMQSALNCIDEDASASSQLESAEEMRRERYAA